MDSNLRIRADALGLRAENYEGGRIRAETLYGGVVPLSASTAAVDALGKRKAVPVCELPDSERAVPERVRRAARRRQRQAHRARPLRREGAAARRRCALGREGIWGVRPRNKEQAFALDLLLDDTVRLVTLVGTAGTGKTLLALAVGSAKRTDRRRRVRAPARVASGHAARPRHRLSCRATIDEKLNPWMQPIFDNLEFLFSTGGGRCDGGRSLRRAARQRADPGRAAHVHPRAHAAAPVLHRRRGAEPHAARGQDDHHALRRRARRSCSPATRTKSTIRTSMRASNGLTTVAERFKTEAIAGHITLSKGERSELAERATELL